MGHSKLKKVVKYLENRQQQLDLGQEIPADQYAFSAALLATGGEAKFLKERSEILTARMAAIKSKQCGPQSSRHQYPEVFLDVVSDKLTSTAVLFLNFELLSDFFYSFPRELDAEMGALSEQQVRELAIQDPAIKRHIELQKRKELLQLALSKIQTVSEMHRGV